MKTFHLAPSDSAGGSLGRAIQDAGGADEVLSFFDDLSCGPIDCDAVSARAAGWAKFDYETAQTETIFAEFWERVATTEDRLVVWFGRHAANELAFLLPWPTAWAIDRSST